MGVRRMLEEHDTMARENSTLAQKFRLRTHPDFQIDVVDEPLGLTCCRPPPAAP